MNETKKEKISEQDFNNRPWFSIQEYGTKNIEPFMLDDKTLNTSLKDAVFDKCFSLNFMEILISVDFKNKGYQVVRLRFPKRLHDIYKAYLESVEERFGLTKNILQEKGCPDFLILDLKKKKYKFVEIKFSENDLNKTQKKWIKKTRKPVFVVKHMTKYSHNKRLTLQESLEMNLI